MTIGGEAMGRHRPLDDQHSGGWEYERPPDNPGGSHDGHAPPPPWTPPRPADPPPGYATDRYAEDRTSGHLPRIRVDDEPGFRPRGSAAVPPHMSVNPLGMPTQDRPRSPYPVSPPRPPEIRRPQPPASVRFMDRARSWAADVLIAVLLVVVATVATWRIWTDHQDVVELQQRVAYLEQQHAKSSGN